MKKQPTEQELLTEYKQGDEKIKASLERLHGKEMFLPKHDYEKLKSLGDCCKHLDIDIEHVKVSVPNTLNKYQDFLQATLEAAIIRDAIANNEEVKLGQRRWSPYFYNASGVGFSFHVSSLGGYAVVGSRLEFSDEKQSNYFGRTFLPIHKRRMGHINIQ